MKIHSRRIAHLSLFICLGFVSLARAMDVPGFYVYERATGNNFQPFQDLLMNIDNPRVSDAQIISNIDRTPQLLKLRTKDGYTLLAGAAQHGRLAVVQHIIISGFDRGISGDVAVNKEVSLSLDTPLSLAAANGHVEIVRYLLDMGPTQENIQKAVEAIRAVPKEARSKEMNQKITAIFHMLEAKIAPAQPTKPSAVAPATKPPVTRPLVQPEPRPAPTIRELENLDALKNLGGKRYQENYNALRDIKGLIEQKTPQGDVAAIKQIRANKTLVTYEMQFGRTLLTIAAQNGRTAVVRALLETGANINYPDEHGNTPLIYAAQNGHTDVCWLLIDRKATINLFNGKKQTALNLALINGHRPVVDLLKQHNAKLFFTMVVTFTPPAARQLAQGAYQNLQREIQQIQQQEQMKNIKMVDLQEVHLSMLYSSFFIDYNEFIDTTTQSIFDTVYNLVNNFQLKEKCIALTRANPFLFQGLEKMGPYIVLRYNAPQGYQQLITELFTAIQRTIQVPVLQTYGEVQKPHISFAQEITGKPKFTADLKTIRVQANPLDARAFEQGVYGLNMRVPKLGTLEQVEKPLFQSKHVHNIPAHQELLYA